MCTFLLARHYFYGPSQVCESMVHIPARAVVLLAVLCCQQHSVLEHAHWYILINQIFNIYLNAKGKHIFPIGLRLQFKVPLGGELASPETKKFYRTSFEHFAVFLPNHQIEPTIFKMLD